MLLVDKMMLLVEHVQVVVVEVRHDHNNVDIDPMMLVMLEQLQLYTCLKLNMDVE
jgi:hypothetical protein